MAVRALEAGLKAARDELDQRLRDVADDLGVRGGFRTSFGDIRDSVTEPSISYDKARLVEWAKANLPHEYIAPWTETITVEHEADVHQTIYKTLENRLYLDGDTVVDRMTGENVDFAKVTPERKHWSAYLTHEAKAGARQAIMGRLDALTALVTGRELES